jgi:predicted HicB family RNase H-like nuclease
MAIAKNPKRNTVITGERGAQAFISGAGKGAAVPQERQLKEPIMVRIAPDLLSRIDNAAKRLGISRSAFIVSSTAERLERME